VKFQPTDIAGVILVEAEPKTDERGFFARLYCPDEFAAAKIGFKPVQVSLSPNQHMHTLRGMHFQNPPHAEAKLVHVTRGAAYDVVVDLRKDSATFGRWAAFELNAETAHAVFVPQGCAHGFLTLAAETDVLYHIDRMLVAGKATGYRWDDPVLGIRWPAKPAVMSAADRAWPDFSPGGNS
jgi:dTDP-4-dehydrorhamnose 3,5-epimerase